MNLMIVESPAKAQRIAALLGQGWRVEACRGHVRDLPETTLGIAVEANFRPSYTVLPGKGPLVHRLVRAMQAAEAVYLATDPDREGEAIAWHLLELAGLPPDKPVYRAAFHSLTAEAVQAAVRTPRALDTHLVEAQAARRILDRLVGYLISPLASQALDGRFSAGRVQSAGLRLVVERERALQAFVPQTHWSLALTLRAGEATFTAALEPYWSTREPLERLATLLETAPCWVAEAGQTVRTRPPEPPFTTAALQQAAAQRLGLAPERTMALAQTLYERGWITYPRTDGVTVAPEAQAAARDVITRIYGADDLPEQPPVYTVKAAHAQEAHEAIRPTEVHFVPEEAGEAAALYSLIRGRFLASHMAPARYTLTGAIIQAGKTREAPFPLAFRAQERVLQSAGFLRVDDDVGTEHAVPLPPLHEGQALTLDEAVITEHPTRAPARCTEASLIHALERRGIGRPSTYAAILRTLKARGYLRLEQGQLVPTAAGRTLCDFLTAHFGDLLADDYTARLEAQLDEVASGALARDTLLHTFWTDFQPQLHQAAQAVAAARPVRPLTLHPVVTEAAHAQPDA